MAGFFVRSFSIGQVAKAACYIHFKHTGVKKCHIHATNALSTEDTCAPNGAAQTRKDLPAGIAICMCHAIPRSQVCRTEIIAYTACGRAISIGGSPATDSRAAA